MLLQEIKKCKDFPLYPLLKECKNVIVFSAHLVKILTDDLCVQLYGKIHTVVQYIQLYNTYMYVDLDSFLKATNVYAYHSFYLFVRVICVIFFFYNHFKSRDLVFYSIYAS